MLPEPDPTPAVCVVVPTHNRAHLLPRLVAALEAQVGAPPFEAIIVDDASTDDTWSVLGHLCRRTTLSLRRIRLAANRGPATARNVAWQETSAPLIAFTDDDCAPEPGWLAALAAAAASGADVVQGRTIADVDQLQHAGPFSRMLEVDSETGFYQTCNIAYRRDWLERLGGFAEQFRYPAGEDTDLAWRARSAGARTSFSRDAVVRHDVSTSNLVAAVKDSWRWQSVALAARRHPELRGVLVSRHVWRRQHALALWALAGIGLVAVAPRRPVAWLGAAAAAAPYVKLRTKTAPLPGVGPRRRWLLLPGAFVLDGAELTACLVGSVKHRTLII
ncbi:MAG TPA: glycosyltransferase [Mycobacteriales bacterium]|nr:glycosyltransferase [Mycobacteriales bacterium]